MVSTRQYIDKDGKAVIDATKYESAAGFSDGLAAVKVSHQGWGFIDKAGSLVIPPRFESATSFSEGLAGVLLHGEWRYINKTGTLVIDNKFDWVGRFSERVAVVQRSSKPKRPAVPLGSPSTKIVEVWDLTDNSDVDHPNDGEFLLIDTAGQVLANLDQKNFLGRVGTRQPLVHNL
jgi:WG containing repeat